MSDPLIPVVLPLVLPDDSGLRDIQPGECFFCHQKIGTSHLVDCVCLNKKVKVRMSVEYEIEVPYSWDDVQIEWHRNEGSWCADNALEELERVAESESCGCLCNITVYKVLETTNPGPYATSSVVKTVVVDEIDTPMKRID